jgi:hypothetical protein
MFVEKVKTAVIVSKLMPHSNKAQLLTYAVHNKGSSLHWKKIQVYFFYFGLSHTHFFKSCTAHSLVTDGDAAIRHINFISEKKHSTNYAVS